MKSIIFSILCWFSKRNLKENDNKKIAVVFRATNPNSTEEKIITTIHFPYVAEWIKIIVQDLADTQGPWVKVVAYVGDNQIAHAFGKGFFLDSKGRKIWVERPAINMSAYRLSQ